MPAFRKLEVISSETFTSLARLEDKAVNFLTKSDFAAKHPKIASLASGAGACGVISFIQSSSSDRIGLSLQSAGVGIAAALATYVTVRSRHIVMKHGIDPRKFDKLDEESLTEKVRREHSRLVRAVANHPRTSALMATLTPFLFLHYSSGVWLLPIEKTTIELTLGAGVYLGIRLMATSLRNLSYSKKGRSSFFGELSGIFARLSDTKPFSKLVSANYKARLLDLAVGHYKSIAEADPSMSSKLDLATAYLEAGRMEEGLLSMKEATESPTAISTTYNVSKGQIQVYALASALSAIKRGTANQSDYVRSALALDSIGERGQKLKTIDDFSERFHGIDSQINAAILLETVNEPEKAKDCWNRVVLAVFSQPQLKVLPVSEHGVHNVRRYGPTPLIAGTFVFKEAYDRESHEFEKHLIHRVRALPKNSYYALPQVVSEFSHRNGGTRYDLVLRYIEGQSPAEMQQASTLTKGNLLSIVSYLAWIHKNVRPESSRKGRINLDAKLEQILQNPHLAIPEDLAAGIKASIGLIIERQNSSPFVFAKDPHPAQWRFGRDYLAALDWEDMGSTSLFVDSAKFYIHPDITFSEDALDAIHGEASALYRDSLFGDDSEFRTRLLDATLFQALSFVSAWSVPQMKHMRGKRAAALAGTSQAFSMIRRNHPAHYRMNRLSYDGLESCFKEVTGLLMRSS